MEFTKRVKIVSGTTAIAVALGAGIAAAHEDDGDEISLDDKVTIQEYEGGDDFSPLSEHESAESEDTPQSEQSEESEESPESEESEESPESEESEESPESEESEESPESEESEESPESEESEESPESEDTDE